MRPDIKKYKVLYNPQSGYYVASIYIQNGKYTRAGKYFATREQAKNFVESVYKTDLIIYLDALRNKRPWPTHTNRIE